MLFVDLQKRIAELEQENERLIERIGQLNLER